MSLDGVYDEQNIFARILRGEVPVARICEDDTTLAFMDVFPQSRGHALVVHRTSKARNLLDVGSEDLCAVMGAVQRVTRAVRAALAPDGIVISQFNGEPAGQTIFHLHVHVIPRWNNVPLGRHGAGEMADFQSLARLAGEIAACLGPLG